MNSRTPTQVSWIWKSGDGAQKFIATSCPGDSERHQRSLLGQQLPLVTDYNQPLSDFVYRISSEKKSLWLDSGKTCWPKELLVKSHTSNCGGAGEGEREREGTSPATVHLQYLSTPENSQTHANLKHFIPPGFYSLFQMFSWFFLKAPSEIIFITKRWQTEHSPPLIPNSTGLWQSRPVLLSFSGSLPFYWNQDAQSTRAGGRWARGAAALLERTPGKRQIQRRRLWWLWESWSVFREGPWERRDV